MAYIVMAYIVMAYMVKAIRKYWGTHGLQGLELAERAEERTDEGSDEGVRHDNRARP